MADDTKARPTELNETKARAGAWGRDVFWVLAFSTVLAAIIVTIAWVYQAPRLAKTNPGTTQSPAVASQFHTPPQAHPAPALSPNPNQNQNQS